jgi:phytanoyl-CoA hydroxylase
MPGSGTVVKWHQDFTFDPCSNDDSITIIVFVDNVTADNGVIMLSPGSHKGPYIPFGKMGYLRVLLMKILH